LCFIDLSGSLLADEKLDLLNNSRNCIYRSALKREEKIAGIYTDSLPIPATVIGVVERVFFGVLVAFNIQAAGATMGARVVVKIAMVGSDYSNKKIRTRKIS